MGAALAWKGKRIHRKLEKNEKFVKLQKVIIFQTRIELNKGLKCTHKEKIFFASKNGSNKLFQWNHFSLSRLKTKTLRNFDVPSIFSKINITRDVIRRLGYEIDKVSNVKYDKCVQLSQNSNRWSFIKLLPTDRVSLEIV